MGPLGVVGGLGPRATAEFYQLYSNAHARRHGGAQPDLMLANVPVTSEIEADFIAHGRLGQASALEALLARACERLAASGCRTAALLCNTLQPLFHPIARRAGLDPIDLFAALASHLAPTPVRRIHILSSAALERDGGCRAVLKAHGWAVADWGAPDRAIMTDALLQIVQGRGQDGAGSLSHVLARQVRPGDTVLLACTDLLVRDLETIPGVNCVSSLDILVEACLQAMTAPAARELA